MLLLLQIPPALFLRYSHMDVDPPAAEGDNSKQQVLLHAIPKLFMV
jgi:hypothetical protein